MNTFYKKPSNFASIKKENHIYKLMIIRKIK